MEVTLGGKGPHRFPWRHQKWGLGNSFLLRGFGLHAFIPWFIHAFISFHFIHASKIQHMFHDVKEKNYLKLPNGGVQLPLTLIVFRFRTYCPRVLHPFIRYTPAPGVQGPKLRLQPLEVADLRLEHWSCRIPLGRRSLNFSFGLALELWKYK